MFTFDFIFIASDGLRGLLYKDSCKSKKNSRSKLRIFKSLEYEAIAEENDLNASKKLTLFKCNFGNLIGECGTN